MAKHDIVENRENYPFQYEIMRAVTKVTYANVAAWYRKCIDEAHPF